MKQMLMTAAAVAVWLAGSGLSHAKDSFYKEPPLFNFTHADEALPKQSIDRFGPVGMSIDLRLPPFQMVVGKIEEGSPAAATGKFSPGQKIESINGQVLKDIDRVMEVSEQIIYDRLT